MRRAPAVLALLSVLAVASVATAAPVLPTSYAMPNGFSGSYNYWDEIYSGSGSVTTDGAPLSGGLGDLTDGVIASDNWFVVEAPPGNGPYVGWNIDPVITFNFAPGTTVNAMTIYVDDSNGNGGVSTPGGVRINGGAPIGIADPATAVPLSFTFSGLNLTGPITLELGRRTQWVFMSEVTFDGRSTPVVPEPTTLALLGAALGGAIVRRRRGRVAR